jgi:hypothetical protein
MRAMLVIIALGASACARDGGPMVTAIDLVKLVEHAEKRPAGARFDVAERSCGSAPLAGLAAPVPSRVTYRLNFPRHARLVTTPVLDGATGASAEFRIGISDRRTYETLAIRIAAAAECGAGASPMVIDLSLYGGWQWSLFYRPDERTWELILGVNAVAGEIRGAMWGMPRIETNSRDARAFLAR